MCHENFLNKTTSTVKRCAGTTSVSTAQTSQKSCLRFLHDQEESTFTVPVPVLYSGKNIPGTTTYSTYQGYDINVVNQSALQAQRPVMSVIASPYSYSADAGIPRPIKSLQINSRSVKSVSQSVQPLRNWAVYNTSVVIKKCSAISPKKM